MIVLVFDCETTGLVENLLVAADRQPEVIEFASVLVDLDSGEIISEYETLVRPTLRGGRLEEKIVKITGITQEDVDGARTFPEVAKYIEAAIDGAPAVLGHNVRFDMEMIDLEFGRMSSGVRWPAEVICTAEQSAHYLGRRLSQVALYSHLGLGTYVAHRAMADVRALVQIAVEMRRRSDL